MPDKRNERIVISWNHLIDVVEKIKTEWNNPPVLWYRGHTSYDYELIPSLFRFHGGAKKERELFREFVKFMDNINTGYNHDDWYILFNMQHFGIPTRLLDWTEVIGIALFFAVTGNTDMPCIFMLNPEKLNMQSGEPSVIMVPNEYNFAYKKRFWYGDPEQMVYPKAIAPSTYCNPRIQRQRGNFTIHGNREEPLEELRPDCVIKIVLKGETPKQAKQYLQNFNQNMLSLFPDTHGLSIYIRHQVELKPLDRLDIIIEKVKRKLNKALEDFRNYLDDSQDAHDEKSRDGFTKPPYPFSPDIVSACKLKEDFIERKADIEALNYWINNENMTSIAFLLGEAGIGKTNLLLYWILYGLDELSPDQGKPVLFYPMQNYDSNKTSLPIDLLKIIFPSEEISAGQKIAFEENVRQGKIVIVLDGLDELARTKGSQEALASIKELMNLIGDHNKARVAISCRDHVFTRLSQGESSNFFKNAHKIPLTLLPNDKVKERIHQRIKNAELPDTVEKIIDHLIEIACHPLYLDVVVDMLKFKSDDLKGKTLNKSQLYNLWFDFVLQKHKITEPDEAKKIIARIAGAMLDNRTDNISSAELIRRGLTEAESILSLLSPDELVERKNASTNTPVLPKIFAQVSSDSKSKSWAFIHQSLREFILAWSVYQEIKERGEVAPSGKTNNHIGVLSGTSAFDYESQETYCYLIELFPDDKSFAEIAIETVEKMCPAQTEYACYDRKTKQQTIEKWNHVVRNLFEAIGIIASEENDHVFAETVIPKALEILNSGNYNGLYVRYRTKYNIVRCLERLHPHAPKPYYITVLESCYNQDKPSSDLIYAFAVRGFHSINLKINSFPPMIFSKSKRPKGFAKIEKRVSDCLLHIIERMTDPEISEFANYLRINCSFALIRWFPENPKQSDLDRIDKLLTEFDLSHEIALNLFYTLYRRTNGKIPPQFKDKFNMINLEKLTVEKVPIDALTFLREPVNDKK